LAFSYWTIKPWFLTEGKLDAVLITPSLGVPNWSVIYIINTAPPTSFLAPLPGSKEEEAPTSTTFSHVNYAPAVIKTISLSKLLVLKICLRRGKVLKTFWKLISHNKKSRFDV
jgi:hypothetical protein